MVYLLLINFLLLQSQFQEDDYNKNCRRNRIDA
jgi:hypothetical protein